MDDKEKKAQEMYMEFQMIEQQLENILMQKQNFQVQLSENENASEELKKTKKDPYKIIGAIMVSSDKENLLNELKEQEEILNLRLKTLEKQEKSLKDKAESLQNELMEELK